MATNEITIANDILIKLLLENNETALIKRALEIQHETIKPDFEIGEIASFEVSNSTLKSSNLKFAKDKSYGVVNCQIIDYNPYKIKDAYQIIQPNGTKVWNDPTNSTISELEEIVPTSDVDKLTNY